MQPLSRRTSSKRLQRRPINWLNSNEAVSIGNAACKRFLTAFFPSGPQVDDRTGEMAEPIEVASGNAMSLREDRLGLVQLTCSNANSRFFASSPPAKPCSAPVFATTRWQGTMIASGLRPQAAPAARAALGRPTRRANSP
jgi:hypothetical protein